MLTTHPEIEEDCDFVYHKGASISYFARQNLTEKGFFSCFGNYNSFEKPLKVINITVNYLFQKLNQIYDKNQLKEKFSFEIDKQVLANIDQQLSLLQIDPAKKAVRQKLEEQQISNEMAYLFIGMYHYDNEKISTTKYLETFKKFVKEVELRDITQSELNKIKLLISDRKNYLINWKQINDFFKGFWTSPTDFEYLEIPEKLPSMDEWPHKKITLVLEKISPDYSQSKNLLFNNRGYTEINIGDSIEIHQNENKPIIFGRKSKLETNNFFIFSAEQKLVSRHQFQFQFHEDKKFRIKCTSTGNPTCIKLKQNQEYILREGIVFFIGRSQGFLITQIKHGNQTRYIDKPQIIDIFGEKQRNLTLLEKRVTQSIKSNINDLIRAQKKYENLGKSEELGLGNSGLQIINEEEEKKQTIEPTFGPFIEIMGLGEKEEQFKTDFAWVKKTFYAEETNCILLGSSDQCSLRFENEEIQPYHAEIIYNEKYNKWMLTCQFPDAETFISLKNLEQLKHKDDTKAFDIQEGMIIAVECNEFKIDKIEREEPEL